MNGTADVSKLDVDWMQGRWRNCADKRKQLAIFHDMTGRPANEILVMLGEDPKEWKKADKPYRSWTPEEDAKLISMCGAGKPAAEIAETLGREVRAINVRTAQLMPKPKPKSEKAKGNQKKQKVQAEWWESAADELTALLAEESRILTELKAVRDQIAVRRGKLKDMIGFLGGENNVEK